MELLLLQLVFSSEPFPKPTKPVSVLRDGPQYEIGLPLCYKLVWNEELFSFLHLMLLIFSSFECWQLDVLTNAVSVRALEMYFQVNKDKDDEPPADPTHWS